MSEGKPSVEARPSWDKSLPGDPAAFADPKALDPSELEKQITEALAFASTAAATLMTDKMRFLEQARRQLMASLPQITVFLGLSDHEKVDYFRHEAAQALLKLGEFNQAKVIYHALADEADAIADACQRANVEEHDCERPLDTIKKPDKFDAPITLDRRFRVGDQYNPMAGFERVMQLWQCSKCQMYFVLDEPPMRQSQYETMRKQAAAHPADKPFPSSLSDHSILKSS